MTRDEFKKRWKHRLAGIIALGSAKATKINTGPFAGAAVYGEMICNLEETTDALLDAIYQDLALLIEKPLPVQVNGAKPQTQVKR